MFGKNNALHDYAGAKGPAAGKKASNNSQVAKMFGKAPPKKQKVAAIAADVKAASQSVKSAPARSKAGKTKQASPEVGHIARAHVLSFNFILIASIHIPPKVASRPHCKTSTLRQGLQISLLWHLLE